MSHSRQNIDSCTIELHNWKPFQLSTRTKGLESDFSNSGHTKRPCLTSRTTSFSLETLDMSRLSLLEDENRQIVVRSHKRDNFKWIAKKRRRRGSRSVSGRSSDRSGTRRYGSGANATCSDFPVTVGTDSSGELFVSGDGNWGSDLSEAKNSRRERGAGEKENSGLGFGQVGNFDLQGTESGYGSEPGYRGDAEFGYGDEIDDEDDDQKLPFWGEQFGDTDANMEGVGENTFSDQKAHYRCRRKKHDIKMFDYLS